MSKEGLASFPDVAIPARDYSIKEPTKTPTGIFNDIVYPLVQYKIKGVIW